MEDAEKDSPKKVIEDYLAAVREANGEAVVSQTGVRYENGWFLTTGPNNEAKRLRKQQILSLTEFLRTNSVQTRIISDYLDALRRAKGENYALATRVEYLNGWFVVGHANGEEKSYRKKQIIFFTEALQEESFDGEAYERAQTEKLESKRKQLETKNRIEQWQKLHADQEGSPWRPIFARFALWILLIVGCLAFGRWVDQSKEVEAAKKAERAKEDAIEKTKWKPNHISSPSRTTDDG